MPLRRNALSRFLSNAAATSPGARVFSRETESLSKYRHNNAILDHLQYHEDKKEDHLARAKHGDKLQEAKQWGFQVGWNTAGQDADRPKSLRKTTVLVKDNIATADLETTCASHILDGWRPTRDATVVQLLRREGSLILGKTNLDEFGMGSHNTHSAKGRVKNGLSLTTARSVGGSSGGSAIAVATRQCSFALGTDTGGSVRLPAAYTGIFGFKPSYGLLSRNGVVPYANSLDTVGILARNCKTIRDAFLAVNHPDPMDPTNLAASTRRRLEKIREQRLLAKSTKSTKYRIGVPIEYNVAELDPLVHKAWARTLSMLENAGHEIISISLPSTRQALSAYYVLAPAEASSNLAKYDGVRYGASHDDSSATPESPLFASLRGLKFGEEVKRRILLGTYSLSATAMDNYFIQAQRIRRLVQTDFDRVFKVRNPLRGFDKAGENSDSETVDFIICPTAPTPPPRVEDIERQDPINAYVNDVFTVPASLAGLPAISIPAPLGTEDDAALNWEKLIGMQIIGQYGDDHGVLDCADTMATLDPEIERRHAVVEGMNAYFI